MQSIKVKRAGGLENIYLSKDTESSAPVKGEVKVKILASSLNYHDYLVADGHLPLEQERVLLSDGAGVVVAVGQGVTEFKVGDHVVSTFFPQWLSGSPSHAVGDFAKTPGDGIDGMAAEYVTRDASAFTVAPKGWSHLEASTITTAGLTAWRALVSDGNLKAGETIVTLGTGGVSLAALQIGKMFGAKVIVTSSSDEKLQSAKALGADHIINYKTNPEWAKDVLAITDGKGAEHIIEVGGPGTLAQSVESVAVGGNIYLIGVLTGFEGNLPTAQLMFKQTRLQGLLVGSRSQQQDYVKALEANNVRPVIDKVFDYGSLADAFRYQVSGSHFGKICVQW
ncbi:zinc-dependent alcohol dehydrogenase family protein [Pseudoalteromonas obscura]|uniref:NAD(P)-dependent alcohol dehydrogenase n=1 Tax=Pseudoalteromonas obscura TaxID=3048491 RepID=A0ABT7ENK0_9GAMM|nr:NAD(P)-dependent alcohol dehydrogenase [Pseudoalteromonas sp. P94(2023)]MDK2596624.1 NAD(P)-dependent alcohol dehydrogenase [Pseudoalteromonas sp. P94(2023)]